MSIKYKFTIEKSKILFTSPIDFGQEVLREKQNLIIKAKSDHSKYPYLESEVSAIKSMHHISINDTFNIISDILKKIEIYKINLSSINLEKPLFNLYPQLTKIVKNIPINCLYGLENLFLPFITDYLKLNLKNQVQSNGLIIPGHLKSISILDYSSYKHIKYKLGRLTIEEDIDVINQLLKNLPKEILLRLDGNQRLSITDIKKLREKIDQKRIQYYEEPCKNILKQKLSIPLAIDESLDIVMENNIYPKNTVAFIIKPSVKLGISGTFTLINKLRSNESSRNIDLVISSCFESYVGMYGLITLAIYQDLYKKTSHGLDTYKYLDCENKSNLKFDKNHILMQNNLVE